MLGTAASIPVFRKEFVMVYLLLADGFEECEALYPLDLLRRAGVDVRTVSVSGAPTVTGAHGICVWADLLPEGAREAAEMVILPGGMPGSLNLDASPVTDRILAATVEAGGRLAAICAAPLVLGRRGLLKGLRATCYPGFEEELMGATTAGERVVTDGGVTTAIGMGAAEEFGRELCRLLCGEEKAASVLASIHAR